MTNGRGEITNSLFIFEYIFVFVLNERFKNSEQGWKVEEKIDHSWNKSTKRIN